MAVRRDGLAIQIDVVAESLLQLRARLDEEDVALDALLSELHDIESRLLGVRAPVLRALDARSAVDILWRTDVVRSWAGVLRVAGEVRERLGERELAAAARRRADALETAAARRDAAALRMPLPAAGAGEWTHAPGGLTLADFRELAPYAMAFLGLGGAFAYGDGRLGVLTCTAILLTKVLDAGEQWVKARRCGCAEACGCARRRGVVAVRLAAWSALTLAGALLAASRTLLVPAGVAGATGIILLAAGYRARLPLAPPATDASRPSSTGERLAPPAAEPQPSSGLA